MAPKTVKPNGKGASAPKASPAPKKAAKRAPKKAPATKKSASHYIRNLHNGAGGSRIDLSDGTRIQLSPRGQDGDLALVTKDMADDPIYQRNINVLFEELTRVEGLEVIDKQHINAQVPRQTTMEYLTNEKGQKYAQTRATVTPTFESQGQVVGHVSEAAEGVSSARAGEIAREPVMGPQEVQVPGSRPVFDPNVMPPGLTMEQAAEYMNTPPERRMDLLARFSGENIDAYRDSLSVSVAPTQR